MNAIRPLATLLATAALATLPLAASAHEDYAKHDHGTDAHAQVPQGVDKVLTPDQIDLSSGKAILDANDHYNVRILRIQIPANKELQPHGPKEGYFFVNVISGTLQLGFGNTYDASKLQTLPPAASSPTPPASSTLQRPATSPSSCRSPPSTPTAARSMTTTITARNTTMPRGISTTSRASKDRTLA